MKLIIASSQSISLIKILLPRHLFQPPSDGKEPNAWRLILRPPLNSGGVSNPSVKALAVFLSFTHSDLPPFDPLIGYNAFDLVVAFICCYKIL